QAGALESLLDRVATYKEKTESLKAKIKKAMTYPIAVVIVAFIVTGILLIKVVPQFQTLFSGFGADLPAFTVMVINLSQYLQDYWFFALVALFLMVFAFRRAHKTSEKFRNWLDRTLLKVPVIGQLLYKSANSSDNLCCRRTVSRRIGLSGWCDRQHHFQECVQMTAIGEESGALDSMLDK
nr:hypothetical protein [Tanacetum cinerariifolium]